MTTDFCRDFCQMSKDRYKYYVLVAGDQCLCLNAVVEWRQRVDDRSCQTVCSGDRFSSCGGDSFMAVFRDPSVPLTINTQEIPSSNRPQVLTATTLLPSDPFSAAAAAAVASTPQACIRIVVHTGAVTVAVTATLALAVFVIIFLVYLKRRGKRNSLSRDTTDNRDTTYAGLQTLSAPDSVYQGLSLNAESKSNDPPADQIYENQVVGASQGRKGHLYSNAGACGDNEYSFCE
ncbi:uncharacterized protein [Diadema setosum]|uniref:uncharacterized protein n=1 Tax=Diadema setosum TaxID=31175 RepID=UPI003B3A78C3